MLPYLIPHQVRARARQSADETATKQPDNIRTDLCEKQNQHVRREIEIMFTSLKVDPSSFGRILQKSEDEIFAVTRGNG